jgi:cell wall-associated NlpC family hydrolase
LDCWGLLRYFYREEYGIDLLEYAVCPSYLEVSDKRVMELLQGWREVEIPQEGDAVALGNTGNVSHVGVYVIAKVPSILHIGVKSTSHLDPLRFMYRNGWTLQKFYRHDSRYTGS